MDETTGMTETRTGERVDSYETPRIFDLGAVVEVTNGSSTGGADSNGQGLY